jgi:hypothetical protein
MSDRMQALVVVGGGFLLSVLIGVIVEVMR